MAADIEGGHGDGGQSIFGPTFADECFTVTHSAAGMLVRCHCCCCVHAPSFVCHPGPCHVGVAWDCAGDGQRRRAAHQQLAVLRHVGAHALDGWQAGSVWACCPRHASVQVSARRCDRCVLLVTLSGCRVDGLVLLPCCALCCRLIEKLDSVNQRPKKPCVIVASGAYTGAVQSKEE